MTDDTTPRPSRSDRWIDWGLALTALGATTAFVLWAPIGARSVWAWMG